MASCLPLVLLGVQVANVASGMLRSQIMDNVALAGQVESDRLESSVDSAIERIRSVENDPVFAQSASELGSIQTGSAVTGAVLADFIEASFLRLESDGLRGIQLWVSGEGSSRFVGGELQPESEAVRLGIGSEEVLVGDVFLSNGEPRIGIVRRVRSGASSVSMWLVTEWDLGVLFDGAADLSDTFKADTRTLLLQPTTAGDYEIIHRSDSPVVGSAFNLQTNPNAFEPAPVLETTDQAGDPVVQAAARVEVDPGWIVVIEVDQAGLYSTLNRIRQSIIGVFVGAGFVILAVVAIALRGFANRLGRMTILAEAVASGDLTVRTGDHRLDELGRLSLAFDDMTQALAEDIARRERVEAQLAYQATHDSLTGLPNRHQLVKELDEVLLDQSEQLSVLFVDLDGFKAVNDRYGHGAGDDLLVRVAERLREVLRPGDFVARLGGDEFVIVLRGLQPNDAERVASRVVSVLEMPFVAAGTEVQISASIGVATGLSTGDGPQSSERLLKQADVAMYRAKATGKGRAVRVTEDSLAEDASKTSIVSEVRSAIDNDELELLMWPIADLESGEITGLESTVRWASPTRGLVVASDFLPIAQDAGLGSAIDEWVIASSLNHLASWRDSGFEVEELEMSVNLSTETFLDPRSRQVISTELGRHGFRASNLRIEVPEEVLRGDGAMLRQTFDTYRAVGMAVTLDRFGSDYANLDRLASFAIDAVKIDLALISALGSRSSSRAFVRSLITLAFTAGLRVSAAGIDDEATRAELVELGCGVGQGLWLSSALTPDQFVEMLRSRDYIDIA